MHFLNNYIDTVEGYRGFLSSDGTFYLYDNNYDEIKRFCFVIKIEKIE